MSDFLEPTHLTKTPLALNSERTRHRVSFVPNKAFPKNTLRVNVPKLDEGTILVPGSLYLVFDLIAKGDANNYFIVNLGRGLVSRMIVKFAGEVLMDNSGYDIYKIFEDLFIPKDKRMNMLLEGITGYDFSKFRANAANRGANAHYDTLMEVYGTKHRIPLDHQILTDQGVFTHKRSQMSWFLKSHSLMLAQSSGDPIHLSLTTSSQTSSCSMMLSATKGLRWSANRLT